MTIYAKFPGTCVACRHSFPAGAEIEWTKGVGARHKTNAECDAARAAKIQSEREQGGAVLDLKPIQKFLRDAQSRGLKSPKLRVLAMDNKSELRLALTTKGMAPGSISVVLEDGKTGFMGCIRPDGTPTKTVATDRPLQEHLLLVAKDPVSAAKAYAALMCRCSFCGLALTDAGSVEVGYGPICAQHWGLPHKPKGTPALKPVPQQQPQSSYATAPSKSRWTPGEWTGD